MKVAPDLDAGDLRDVTAVVKETGMDAVVAGNTTLSRPAGVDPTFANEPAGSAVCPWRRLRWKPSPPCARL